MLKYIRSFFVLSISKLCRQRIYTEKKVCFIFIISSNGHSLHVADMCGNDLQYLRRYGTSGNIDCKKSSFTVGRNPYPARKSELKHRLSITLGGRPEWQQVPIDRMVARENLPYKKDNSYKWILFLHLTAYRLSADLPRDW